MNKIKVLEVNNIDLIGNRFNGYDMIEELSGKDLEIKQAVLIKQSDNDKVVKIINNYNQQLINDKLFSIEQELSIKNVLTITTPLLKELKEYKEADIIHFHMFHNTNLSIYSLREIAKEKKVVLTLHDPWFFTGHCVHFYECNKWKTGCEKCPNLDSLFAFKKDNCSDMWNLKKETFNNLDIDLVVSTEWMHNLIIESPIMKTQKNTHIIPFGIDYKKFQKVTPKEARNHYGFEDDEIVLFLRAQNEFKGTPYVLEALKELDSDKKITVLTCDNKNLLDDVSDEYKIVDLGSIKDDEMIYAMNACDIFLMPSLGESFGMMAIEAMSCKKPVVVFDNSALPSVTKTPKCGYLVKNRDSHDLKEAIEFLVDNKKEREERGKLGFELVKKEYANEVYNNRLKELYKEVYKRKRKENPVEIIEASENSEQIKFLLNDLTVRIFGTSSKESKELCYNMKGIKRKRNYHYQFSDIALQEVLEEYFTTLAENLNDKVTIPYGKRSKVEKLIYFAKNNPKRIIEMLK